MKNATNIDVKSLTMDLLNAEEIAGIKGGNAAGDVVFKKCVTFVGDITIVTCLTLEAGCPATFTYECGLGDVTCSENFTLKPKK